jgi:hypothetical protein
LLFEIRAPAIDFASVSRCEFIAVNSHVRIIIIWNGMSQVPRRSQERAFTGAGV